MLFLILDLWTSEAFTQCTTNTEIFRSEIFWLFLFVTDYLFFVIIFPLSLFQHYVDKQIKSILRWICFPWDPLNKSQTSKRHHWQRICLWTHCSSIVCHSFGCKIPLNGAGTGTRTWGTSSILIFCNVFFFFGSSFTNLTVVWLLVGNLDLWNSREACKTKAFFQWHTVEKARVLSFLSLLNHLLYSGSHNQDFWKWVSYLAFLLDI